MKKLTVITVQHDPKIIRQGKDITILAPVAEVAADFGSSQTSPTKDN